MSLNLGEMYVLFDAQTTSFHKKAAGVGSALEGVGSKAKSLGQTMSLAITAPAVIAAGASIAAFTSFDAKMRNVNTIAKLSETQLVSTVSSIKDMGVELGKTPMGLADSLYDIYSSGFAGAEALNMLRTSTIAASAGLATTQEAGKGIMAVINAYGLSAKEAEDVSDIFFKTVERGVTTFPELASGVGNVISTASILKVPFEEVAAALATMTKGGISTRESVTALNAMFMRLVKGSDELDEAFKKNYGTTASAMMQNEGLGKTIQAISTITAGSADEFKRLGFQTRDFKAAASLARQGGAAFAADLDQIANKANRAGAAQAAYTQQTLSFAFALDKTKAILAVAGVEIGTKLAPYLRSLNSAVQRGIVWWRSLGEGTKDIILTLVGVAAAAGPTLLIFGKMAMAVSALSPLLTGVLVRVAGMARWFLKIGSLGGVISSLWTATVGFVSAVASMALPIIVVVGAVVGLVAALINAYGEGDTFRAKMANIWGSVTAWAGGAWEAVKTFTVGSIGFFANFGENMSLLWTWMQANWRNLLTDMINMTVTYVANQIQNWVTLATKASAVAGVLVGWLKDNWKQIGFDLLDAMIGVLIKMGEIATAISNTIWQAIQNGFTGKGFSVDGIVAKLVEGMATGLDQTGTLGQRLEGLDLFGGFVNPLAGFESTMDALPEFNLGRDLAEGVKPAETLANAIDGAAEAQGKLGTEAKKTAEAMADVWKGANVATAGSAEAAKAITRHFQAAQAAASARGGSKMDTLSENLGRDLAEGVKPAETLANAITEHFQAAEAVVSARGGSEVADGLGHGVGTPIVGTDSSGSARASLGRAVPVTSVGAEPRGSGTDEKVFWLSSLRELGAIRVALERIDAVMISESGALAV